MIFLLIITSSDTIAMLGFQHTSMHAHTHMHTRTLTTSLISDPWRKVDTIVYFVVAAWMKSSVTPCNLCIPICITLGVVVVKGKNKGKELSEHLQISYRSYYKNANTYIFPTKNQKLYLTKGFVLKCALHCLIGCGSYKGIKSKLHLFIHLLDWS